MLPVYYPFGCPGDFFNCQTTHKIKIIIDPDPHYFSHFLKTDRNEFEILILIQGMEPKELSNISNLVIHNHLYFDKILTSFPDVLSVCENSELFLYASSWILTKENKTRANYRSEYYNIFDTNKNFELSFVMSNKNFLVGHKLRHYCKDIIEKKRNFTLNFPQSISMYEKYRLFEKSMFHIAIENTQNINYISEKIVDCFMSYTLPIYWGCPNIDDYFNKEGIIFFETKEELDYILNNLTINDYLDRLEMIKENYEIANKKYAFYSDRVNEVINKLTIK